MAKHHTRIVDNDSGRFVHVGDLINGLRKRETAIRDFAAARPPHFKPLYDNRADEINEVVRLLETTLSM